MSELLVTDVLAVLNVNDYIFVGIGYSLRIYEKSTNSLISQLDVCYPDKIHGIIKGPGNTLAVFGGKNISIVEFNILNKTVQITLLDNTRRFNDWIIAVGWSIAEVDDSTQLAILSAHNRLTLYNWRDSLAYEFQCEEKCILYGGSVVNDCPNNYIVFAGTVFQEIVVWAVTSVTSKKEVPVLHRLRGHNGVIFSVIFDPITSLICSTSDDRTIRLWSVEIGTSDNDSVKWKNATISLVTTMFGHTARVWRAMIRENFVISIGEDSLICIWTTKGTLVKKIEAHNGAPIWSMDVCEDGETIITGGGDGAVHVWPLRETTNFKTENIPITSLSDVPKHVGFLKSGTIIILTQTGKLLVHNNDVEAGRKSIDIKMYSSYVVMQISPSRKRISLASLDGYVTLFEDDSETRFPQKVLEQKIMVSKILSMHWLNDDSLLLCGIEGSLKRIEIKTGTMFVKSEHILPKSRERWTTTAIMHKDLLICGDRAGSIHLFQTNDVENNNKIPFQSLMKIHGRLGVHSCRIVENKLLSTGRDGTLRFYKMCKNAECETMCPLNIDRMPMDWVSTTLKTQADLYVLGFKEVDFVLYSTAYQRVLLRICCGGGHRSWDYTLKDGIFNFVYIRDKQVHLVKSRLKSLAIPAIQNGFHTKEVCCVCRIPTSTGHNVLISGGEDRDLRISQIVTNSGWRGSNIERFETLALLSGHISNVKTVFLLNLENTELHSENLIFSGGGRAQLKIWSIGIKFYGHTLDKNNVNCVELASHMLRGTNQQQRISLKQENQQSYHVDPETRYMNINACKIKANPNLILLLIACSDGFLRIFTYNIINRATFLQTAIPYHNRCIIKTELLNYNENVIALTMATDGIVNFWCLNEILDIIAKDLPKQDQLHSQTDLQPFAKLSLHQCGINSYDLKMLNGFEFILATGGDDNLISLVVFEIKAEDRVLSIHQTTKWECRLSHSTQITGLILDERGSSLISVGIDQKVLTFNYLYERGVLTVSLTNEIITSVPDVQGMITCYTDKSDDVLLCVYGKGFELIRRKLPASNVK